jgi:haloacetate dehalogenase
MVVLCSLGADPEFWIRIRMTARQHGGAPSDAAVMAECIRCFSSPAAIHASCGDYCASSPSSPVSSYGA